MFLTASLWCSPLAQVYSTPMRLVLALLAVLGLLVSPATTAAAQAACGHDGRAPMVGMDMPTMAGLAHVAGSANKGDPCCNPNGKSHKTNDKSCMQACATACAVTVALPVSFAVGRPTYAHPLPNPPVTNSARGVEPAGLERPPKSMA